MCGCTTTTCRSVTSAIKPFSLFLSSTNTLCKMLIGFDFCASMAAAIVRIAFPQHPKHNIPIARSKLWNHHTHTHADGMVNKQSETTQNNKNQFQYQFCLSAPVFHTTYVTIAVLAASISLRALSSMCDVRVLYVFTRSVHVPSRRRQHCVDGMRSLLCIQLQFICTMHATILEWVIFVILHRNLKVDVQHTR